MSLTRTLGRRAEPARAETPEHCRQLEAQASRSSTNEDIDAGSRHGATPATSRSVTLPIALPRPTDGPAGLEPALDELCSPRPRRRSTTGHRILILVDRGVDAGPRPDPGAAGGRRRAPPPDPRGHAHAGGLVVETRRAARGAPLRPADRLRRQRGQPVPGLRDARRHDPRKGSLAGRRPRRAPSTTTSRRSSKGSSR